MPLSLHAKSTLGRMWRFAAEHDRLPTSNELAGPRPDLRARAVVNMKVLEDKGYIERPHPRAYWRQGWLTPLGMFVGALCANLPPVSTKRYTPREVFGATGPIYEAAVQPVPVRPSANGLRVLKSAKNNTKIGGEVLRGRWKGAKIFQLTLPERTTCPRDCALWNTCYGNNMRWATRYEPGPSLENAIAHDCHVLNRRGKPFAIRLHVLGDFYSVGYVQHWGSMLHRYGRMSVFGFTAHDPDSPIGAAIQALNWSRFAIRFSGFDGPRGALVEGIHEPETPTFPCPEQRGTSPSCGACTACWASIKPVMFRQH